MRRVGARRGKDGAERLLAVASRLFAARGFTGVSVRELATAAEVTRPVLYYHFGSKEGLFLAAVRHAATDYDAALARATRSAGAVGDGIRRVCRAHAASDRERTLLARASGDARAAASGAPPGSSPPAGAVPIVEILRALVREGIENGELGACDPGDVALALVGVAETGLEQLSRGADGPKTNGRLDRVLSVILRGLRPKSKRSRSGTTARRGRR